MPRHETYIDIQVKARPPKRAGFFASRFFRRHQRLLLPSGGAVIAIILFVAIISAQYARADVAMVPGTCLGGWSNAEKAAGTPDLPSESPSTSFSSENSASVQGTLADLYCGNFSGTVPKDTRPTAITASFSWAFVPQGDIPMLPASPADLTGSSTPVLDAPQESVGTSEASIPASSDTPVPIDSSSSQTPTDVPTPIESAPPAPNAAPDAPQSRVESRSLFSFLATPVAHAETSLEEGTTTASSTTTDISPVVDAPVPEDAVLDLSYTLDGSTWYSFGTVTRADFARASFVIPVENIHSWDDMQKMQIRIQTLSSVTTLGVMYVDGMTLSVAYGPFDKNAQDEADAALLEAYRATLPERRLHVSFGEINGGDLSAMAHALDDGKEELVIHAPQGSYIVYDRERGFVLGDGLGIDSVHIPAYNFLPGSYTLIATREASGCANLTYEECMQNARFVASVDFTVVDLDATTTPLGSGIPVAPEVATTTTESTTTPTGAASTTDATLPVTP